MVSLSFTYLFYTSSPAFWLVRVYLISNNKQHNSYLAFSKLDWSLFRSAHIKVTIYKCLASIVFDVRFLWKIWCLTSNIFRCFLLGAFDHQLCKWPAVMSYYDFLSSRAQFLRHAQVRLSRAIFTMLKEPFQHFKHRIHRQNHFSQYEKSLFSILSIVLISKTIFAILKSLLSIVFISKTMQPLDQN